MPGLHNEPPIKPVFDKVAAPQQEVPTEFKSTEREPERLIQRHVLPPPGIGAVNRPVAPQTPRSQSPTEQKAAAIAGEKAMRQEALKEKIAANSVKLAQSYKAKYGSQERQTEQKRDLDQTRDRDEHTR